MIFEILSPDYFSTILNSTSEFAYCWPDWVLVAGIASSLLDFRLSTSKNEWWKSEIWTDLNEGDLPRTHVHSLPEVKIHYLLYKNFALNFHWNFFLHLSTSHLTLPSAGLTESSWLRLLSLDLVSGFYKEKWVVKIWDLDWFGRRRFA